MFPFLALPPRPAAAERPGRPDQARVGAQLRRGSARRRAARGRRRRRAGGLPRGAGERRCAEHRPRGRRARGAGTRRGACARARVRGAARRRWARAPRRHPGGERGLRAAVRERRVLARVGCVRPSPAPGAVMRIGAFDTSERVLVVAEVGNNHEGSFERARELVERAAEAGADAVKFQTFRTEHFVHASDRERYARLEGFRLSYDEFAELAELARSRGLLFVSTALDLESARFLAGTADAIKIASGDNDFFPLLDATARTGTPLIVSTGLTDLEQVDRTVAFVEDARGSRDGLALLQCVSGYPTPDE